MGIPPKLLVFSGGSADKKSTCNAGDLGSNPGLGRFPGEGNRCPLQYSGLENSRLYSPWGRKDSETTKQFLLHFHFHLSYFSSSKELLQQCVWKKKKMNQVINSKVGKEENNSKIFILFLLCISNTY